MPINPDQLPERLRNALATAGVEITASNPSPDCTVNGPGGCNKDCANLSSLVNQATAGTATDARLAEAAGNLVRSWKGSGCTVLRSKE